MRIPEATSWARTLMAAALVAGLVAQPLLPGRATAQDAPPPAKAEAKPEAKGEPKPEAKPAAKPAAAAAPASAPVPAEDPVEVALRKAIAYLYKQQKNDNWEEVQRRESDVPYDVKGMQWGGITSMVTYALLAAGENPQDPRVQRAIQWCAKADIIGTYAMGMRLQVWNSMPLTAALKQNLKRDATLLMSALKLDGGERMGMYHYALDPTKLDYDHSASNYGVLGMWAAGQQNLEVPTKFWEVVDKAWRRNQHKAGSWSYKKEPDDGHPATVSMTSAGVATLFITQDMINEGKGGECNGNLEDEAIARGMKWLGENYKKVFSENHKMYALYNIERVGTAGGFKYFGTVDWYEDGAAHLLKTQQADGSWAGGHGPVINTVYGILFLVKGRAPVMMNKLEYALDNAGDKSPAANWNQRPRDIANLSRWAGKQLEKELNWQIVNLKVDIEALHDAPVLYIAGNQVLNFSKEEKAKLKQYVEGGGMILGHADCNDGKFTASFTKLGQELFPAYEFRELPPNHLVYSAHFSGAQWPNKTLRGLSNQARELMILIPGGDPARNWQIRNFSSGQAKASAEMATNVYLYAGDKSTLQSRFKGQTYTVKKNEKKPADRSVRLARLEYPGYWDPEPGGWRRFANLMHNERGIDLRVETVKLGEGKLKAADFPVAHLTGTAKFRLPPAAQKELKEYVEGGGTLIVDAAGGQSEFKDAARTELNAVLGAAAAGLDRPLPADHPVYSAGGQKLAKVGYRNFARSVVGRGNVGPRLRAADVKGRPAVFYSPEDLSVGLVGMQVDGIFGYDPATANELMARLVMHVAGGAPKVAATPAAAATPPGEAKPAGEPEMMEDGKKAKPAGGGDKGGAAAKGAGKPR
jgi:hypothetical protein